MKALISVSKNRAPGDASRRPYGWGLLVMIAALTCVPWAAAQDETRSDTVRVHVDAVDTVRAEAPRVVRRGAPRIVEVYGPRDVVGGETPTYRVRLGPGAVLPIQYMWDFGAGTAAIGNTVTIDFPVDGRYRLTVTARNRLGADTSSVEVTVLPPPAPSDPPVVDELTGEEVLPAGAYTWVVAAHLDRAEARRAARELRDAGATAFVRPHTRPDELDLAFVAVGAYRTEADALADRAQIRELVGTDVFFLIRTPAR